MVPVASQRQHLLLLSKCAPRHQRGCALRLAATAFAGQRVP